MALEPVLIKPSELSPASTVYNDDAMVVDNDGVVQRATPVQVVNAGAPVPTENEAIAGADNTKRMTALRVRQVLDNEIAPAVLRARAWAESATNPDPTDPTSKSSKTWAGEAAISEGEAQDHAVTAATAAGQAIAAKNALLAGYTAEATTLAPGSSATADWDGPSFTLSLGIPMGDQGEQGNAATVSVGSTSTGSPGTNASVTNSGTSSAAVLDFTIPRGDVGPAGPTDWDLISNKPPVIGAGATQANARAAINAISKGGDTGLGAYTSVLKSIGNSSGLTITLDPSTSNFQAITNNGAFTLAAPATGQYTLAVLVTNAASGAGAMTATGFSKVTGTFKTTANLRQMLTVIGVNSTRTLTIVDAS